MYYRDLRVMAPSETVLGVKFLRHEKFYLKTFMGLPYFITASREGGELVGFCSDGNIYLIDEVNNRRIYASDALFDFSKGLRLYRDMNKQREEISAEELPEEPITPKDRAAALAEELLKLDGDAFKDENTFWSGIIEKMTDGVL